GAAATRLLTGVFPSISAASADETVDWPEVTALTRYRTYRAIRRLLEELSAVSGLALLLDDVHWGDEASLELLDYLVRHPPGGRVLIALAYRPRQVDLGRTAFIESAAGQSHVIFVDPFTLTETEEFLGPHVNRADCIALYQESRGIPLYLEALVQARGSGGLIDGDKDAGGMEELPMAVRAALQSEFRRLSPGAFQVVRAAAVVGDEFDADILAVAAQLDRDSTLVALKEIAACDLVHVTRTGREFRFRHPLVRSAIYSLAGSGWRLAAHARIAAHLADLGAPITIRAHHLERSASPGDTATVMTLVKAARTVARQAPAAAAQWLHAALRLMTPNQGNRDLRLELLLALAQFQWASGRLKEGRETARELLGMLTINDQSRFALAVRTSAMIERLLGRPEQSRALLVDGLRQLHDHESSVTVPLRVRLAADSLYRADFRAAQAALDALPQNTDGWEPTMRFAVAAMRPMPAYAAGRITDTIRYIDEADRLFTAVPEDDLAEWVGSLAWLGWTEVFVGQYHNAARRFDRALAIARLSEQSYVVAMLLCGKARAYGMLGRLFEGRIVAEEATAMARGLGSRQVLAIALTQQCLIASWSGDEAQALHCGEQVAHLAGDSSEWWGASAWYAWAVALINANQLKRGAYAVDRASNRGKKPKLDQSSLLSCYELMACAEAERGRTSEAFRWATHASRISHPVLETNFGLAKLARAQALRTIAPVAAATHAQQAARAFSDVGQRVDCGRARLFAARAHVESGERVLAQEQLRHAAEIFVSCGARGLHARALHELDEIG
ncbi:ATP-binding protein, partial [Nonomuraea sp. M3C6]